MAKKRTICQRTQEAIANRVARGALIGSLAARIAAHTDACPGCTRSITAAAIAESWRDKLSTRGELRSAVLPPSLEDAESDPEYLLATRILRLLLFSRGPGTEEILRTEFYLVFRALLECRASPGHCDLESFPAILLCLGRDARL